jgi:ethanolamine ammonia-lyase small subunit
MSLIKLKKFTPARVMLATTGPSIKTHELLKLKYDLAQAQDSVLKTWDSELFEKNLIEQNYCVLNLTSQVDNRALYLQRPDLGKKLSLSSEEILKQDKNYYDLAIIISDGLSARAINENFLLLFRPFASFCAQENLRLAPLCLIPFSRVAIGDHVGELLKTKITLVFIGERPGLSSPASMGIYITYDPKLSRTDADRNCISNIHTPNGLAYEDAVAKLCYLVTMSLKLKFSGVKLKESSIARKHLGM